MRLKRRGFLTAEIMIFLAVIAMMTPIAMQMLQTSQKSADIKVTRERVKAFSKSFERTFTENIKYVNNNCYGWTDVACTSISATPTVKDANTLVFNTLDNLALNTLIGVGCQVTGSSPSFEVQCYDGHGNLFNFAGQNLHATGTQYIDPYNGNLPQITISSTFARPTVVNIDTLVNNAIVNSTQKLNTVSNAIKTYVRAKRIIELGNTCGTDNGTSDPDGGLDSMGDVIVPYVWGALSLSPNTLCSGIENLVSECGCSSHADNNVWEQSINFCTLDSDLEISRFLTNVGLGNMYKTDGLGNILTLVPLSDSNGLEVSCPPPRPQIAYTGLTALPKSRIGIRDSVGTWIRYTDIYSE
jgi:type II secretory pathway pseudopilin PulG